MKYHSVVHTGQRPFPCTIPGCSFRAGWKSVLKKHLIVHVTDRDKLRVYHCDQCDFRAATKGGLKQHGVVHSNVKRFVCDYPSCNFRTKARYLLARHKMVKHERDCKNLEIYSCDQCDYSSKLKWNLSNHIKTHSAKSIACEFPGCNFRCRLAWNLKVHIRRHHDPDTKLLWLCKVIGCVFKTTHKSQLHRHSETHNPDRKRFNCTLCPRSLYGSEALQAHVALCHTGEEWYRCKLCKFSCQHNTALKKHVTNAHASEQEKDSEKMKIHEKYKSSFCNFTNINKRNVSNHQRIHVGEKMFACSYCSFPASDCSTLVKHVKAVHGRPGEQTVKCPICQVKFVKVRTMRRHMKTVHSVRVESLFHCEFCNHSSKYKRDLHWHIQSMHDRESDPEKQKCDSLLELDEGWTQYRVVSRNYTNCSVGDRNLDEPLHNRSQRRNELGIQIKRKPAEEMIFKCNYCSYRSPLAKDVNTHLRRHGCEDHVATTGINFPGGSEQKKDRAVAVGDENGCEEGRGSCDSETVYEKSKLTKVFACGLCDLLSRTYNAALLHSLDHRTLFISLQRVVIC